MFTVRRVSTNPDVVTGWPGRAAVALALSATTLAVMPAAAEAQGDITVRFERSEESVHEGDPLGLSVQFSEPPGRMVPDGKYFVTIRFTRTENRARNQGDYWSALSVKVHNHDNQYYFEGFQFWALEDDVFDPDESVLFELEPDHATGRVCHRRAVDR